MYIDLPISKALLDRDDEDDNMDLATKLAKYSISLPQYAEAFKETNVPW